MRAEGYHCRCGSPVKWLLDNSDPMCEATLLKVLTSSTGRSQDPRESAPLEMITLSGVPWELYFRLRDLPDNDHKRMIFDKATLVIMAPTTMRHERLSVLLNLLIFCWTDERDIDFECTGSMTLRREDLGVALEPDCSYYFSHAAEVRRIEQIELPLQPTPDLALEVDVNSPSKIKLPVYAALGVPEVWIWKADQLRLLVLREGQYVETQESTQLPGFPQVDAARIVLEHWSAGQQATCREFRAFVRGP